MQKPRASAAFMLKSSVLARTAGTAGDGLQKSEAMPLFSQSPYRVGSGPLGP